MALTVMEEVRLTTTMRLADPMALQHVRGLTFGNLTAPMLDQMRQGQVWRSLVSIAHTMEAARERGGRASGDWGPRVPAGGLSISVTPSARVNVALLFGNGRGGRGPDDLRGARVSVAGEHLPEAVRIACRGRRLGDVVDVARYNGMLADAAISRVDPTDWGMHVHLDLPFVQPTLDDLERMRDIHDPATY